MKQQISRFSVLQSTKVITVMYVLMGFFYTLIGIPMVVFGGTELKVMGVLYIFMPIFMGIIGFLSAAFFLWIYNILASRIGGIEFTLDDVDG